jgi:hypothetical protein
VLGYETSSSMASEADRAGVAPVEVIRRRVEASDER